MVRSSSTRVTKMMKVLMMMLIFVLICTIFILGDSFLAKLNPHGLSFCGWCSFKENATLEQRSLPYHLKFSNIDSRKGDSVHILMVFANVNKNREMRNKLSRCLSSLFIHASPPLHVHILTDELSFKSALSVLQNVSPLVGAYTEISLYDVNNITKPLEDLIERMRPHFSYKRGAYYSNSLFYISIGLYKVLPLEKIIIIDIDVKFLDDVKELFSHFHNFSTNAVIGIAREQQPVYRHVLHEYRRSHNKTKAGDPPPDGHTGFNSGVLLLDLEKMRNSIKYSNIVDNSTIILELVEKYKFKGHLGDQDFYSLVNLDYTELFYILPCTWNRQLCQWWKKHGYENVFDQYHICNGKVSLLHGNCNTFISNAS